MHIEYVVAYSVECSRDDDSADFAVAVADDDGDGGDDDDDDGESEEKYRMVDNAARRDGDSN